MQKISIKENINKYRELLLSDVIVERFMTLMSNIPESYWKTVKLELLGNIIESKSNFDNFVKQDDNLFRISQTIDDSLYSEFIVNLIDSLSTIVFNSRGYIVNNKKIFQFLTFHQSLIGMNDIINEMIKENIEKENLVLFSIISEINPTTNVVITALESIQNLIDVLEKIFDEEQTNLVYILDKGSNTNIGIESGVKTATSLFLIFKEIWSWIKTKDFYIRDMKNAAFMDDLSIINELKKMKDEGSLNQEEFLRYKTEIIKNSNKLLGINTIPRKIAIAKEEQQTHEKLLKEYNKKKQLNEGNENLN